ncbi:MAG TPA: dihydropteroate synthase [Anaerolineae bacterium]|nr:dihydropteroate synthase [Anaerolineae bacterium]HQJ51620.1 dihydropteroate synthase [Anaerolineae bacterium]
MLTIIGENIHIISPRVKAAFEAMDASLIQEMALKQVKHGAHMLDLNIGPQRKRGVEVMEWIVNAVQAVTDTPLSLDTTNALALEAGLKKVKRQAMINSTSADPERLDNIMPLAANYGAKIIALTMGKTGIPTTADARVQMAIEVLIPKAMELGIPMSNVYLDPLVLTVNGTQEHAPETLNAVRFFKQLTDPPPMTVVGLSNVSNSIPNEGRSLINRTYLVMLMAAGLDAAIADPLDSKQNEFVRIVQERDTSSGLGSLLVTLYDKTAAMEELEPSDVDMKDQEQVEVWKTAQILYNKVIYAHSYLKM